MITETSDPNKKVSWVGDIAPMLRRKAQGDRNHPSIRYLYNFKRTQSHCHRLQPLLAQGKTNKIGTRGLPISFSKDEQELFSDYLKQPRLIDIDSVSDLKNALQIAIEVEIATIPPYMAALYSLKTQSGYVYDTLTRIIYQEMRHYGLACNLLIAIGGTPETITPETLQPYPKDLPYGLGDGRAIPIRKLTYGLNDNEGYEERELSQVATFMAIEKPDFMRVPRLENGVFVVDEQCKPEMTSKSIGELYTDILTSLINLSNSGAISFGYADRQVANGPAAHVPLFAITSIDDAKRAVDIICSEGEGATDADDGLNPFCVDTESVLAHYFAFSEIYYERRIVAHVDDVTGRINGFSYSGEELDTPQLEAYDMADHPSLKSLPRDSQAFQVANEFAHKWNELLGALHDTFTADTSFIGDAVRLMRECRDAAVETMTTVMPDGTGKVVGPIFEVPVKSE